MKITKRLYNKIGNESARKLAAKVYSRRCRSQSRPKLPSYVQMEPTTRCNLSCIMCMRNDFLKSGMMKNGDMSFANYKKILDKIPSAEKLDLQGVGEPFLNKDLMRMIRYAKSKGIETQTVTNATLIGVMAEDIVKSGLDLLKISFYGATPETYEKIMRNSKMEKIIENVKNVAEMKKKHKTDKPLLELTLGGMHENINELPKLPSLAKEMGIDRLVIGEIYGREKPLLMTKDVKKIVEETKNNCRKLGMNVAISIPSEAFDYTKVCLWPWVAIYITWDGFVKPCCSRPYFSGINFGNAIHEDIDDIWNRKEYVNFRKSLTKGDVPFLCRGCQYDFSVFGEKNEQ